MLLFGMCAISEPEPGRVPRAMSKAASAWTVRGAKGVIMMVRLYHALYIAHIAIGAMYAPPAAT